MKNRNKTKRAYRSPLAIPTEVALELSFLFDSIHTDEASVTVYEFDPVTSSTGDDYFEPDFK